MKRKENNMPVLTTAETVGMKKGVKRGVKRGLYLTIADILEIKFGAAGVLLASQVRLLSDIDTLQKVRAGLKQMNTILEAEALIEAHLQEQAGNGHDVE